MRPLRLLAATTLALLALPSSAQTGGNWVQLAQSPFHGYRFEDGSFVSPSRGWIVDGSGRTFRTVNGGASWQLASTVDGVYHRSAAFVSDTHGFVGSLFSPMRLFETTDGGATMTNVTARISPPIGGGICGLFAVSSDTLVGVGQYSGPAYVIRTTNGGQTWQSQSIPVSLAGSLIDVYFHDGMRGIAVGGTNGASTGGRVVILATEDGGATWTRRYLANAPPAGQGEWAWKISFPSPTVGYVSVERTGGTTAKVLKTTDGGATWTEILIPGGGSLQGIGFITPERGWISGRGQAMQTTDGGATWTVTTALDGSVNRFEFFGDTLGYAFGHYVYVLDARDPTAGAPPPAIPTLALEPVTPNPAHGAATLRFRTAAAGPVELVLFDVLGRRIATLVAGALPAGEHAARWDGRDGSGAPAAPGLYVVRLRSGGEVLSRPFASTR